MNANNKVLIGGAYYGLHNIGDEAIVLSMIKSFYRDLKLDVMTNSSLWIEQQFPQTGCREICLKYTVPKMGLYVVPRRNIFTNIGKIVKEISYYSKFDLYLCGGGTILSDCPWYSLRTVELSGKVKTPTILWGVGMAEINDFKTKTFILKILNKDHVLRIYTRDEFVRDRLLDLGVKQEKLYISYDPAIMLKGRLFKLEKYLDDKQIDIYNNGQMNIGIALSGESDVFTKTPIDVLADALKEIQNKYDANIILIPTGCGQHCRDTDLLKSLSKKLEDSRTVIINCEFEPEDLIEFLKKFTLVISSRLHMNIFAANANVLFLGLVRNKKIIDFSNLMGLPYLEFKGLTKSQVVKAVDRLVHKLEDRKNNMLKKIEEMRLQYSASVNDVLDLINGSRL